MRRLLVMVGLFLSTVAVCVGYGSAGRVTPGCEALRLPTWSPDGKQIAAAGHDAICVMDAEGRHAEPLPSTDVMIDSEVFQLVWARPSFLVANDNFHFFIVPVGTKPLRPIPRAGGDSFSVSAAGNRLAFGVSVSQFATPGPVKVVRLPSGVAVGRVGGNRLNNADPSLSPNGMRVVFVRNSGDEFGHCCRTLGIWTASADGSHLRQLAQTGSSPLWSPAGGKIAYDADDGLRVLSLQGGTTTLLIRHASDVYGWSPDGKRIAFLNPKGRLAVVRIATGKVRTLMKVGAAASVDWSPNSQQLLVSTNIKVHRCYAIWRVPTSHGKPELLRAC